MLQRAEATEPAHRSIVVVDDHGCMRLGVKSALSNTPDLRVVGEAADGPEALAVIRETRPDLVVLDLALPHLSGLEVMRQLRAEQPTLKFVAYSLRQEPWFVAEARAAGASEYVCKSSDPSDLIEAVQRAAVNDAPAPSEGDRAVEVPTASEPARLSKREAAALRLLARGMSVKEVALRLSVGPRTVETYKVRGMHKLQLRSRADLIRFAGFSGWLSDAEEALQP